MLSILLFTITIALLGNTNNSKHSIINGCSATTTLINDTIIYKNENKFIEPLMRPALSLHVIQIFCNFIPFEMYIYYENGVDTLWINSMIKEINKCAPSAMFIVSYNKSDECIPKLNDNGALTFVLNILHEPNDIDLSFIEKKISYKYRWYFITVFEKLIEDDKGPWLKNIFNQFWSLNVLNTVIYYAHNNNNNNNNSNSDNNNNFKIMTYSPFAENMVIQLLENTAATTTKPEIILFNEKLLNMNKYPLRISLFREPIRSPIFSNGTFMGTDALMTQLIIEKMNATFVHLPPTDGNDIGEFLKSGGATGSLAQILSGEVDISFNTRFLRLKQFHRKVEVTHTIGRDDVCILIAKSGLASNISNLFRSFNITVWIAIIIAPFFIYIIFIFIYKIQNNKQLSADDDDDVNNDLDDNIENMFLTFFGWNLVQSKKKLPKRWAPKFLIAFWIMYSLLITSSYNGNLTSNLVLKRTLPDITTVKQLENSNYQLLTYSRYVDYIQDYLNQSTNSFKRLRKNVRGVSADELSDHIRVNDVRYAYANKYHINKNIVKSKSHFYRGRPIFNLMRECPVPNLVAYAVTYGSPYLGRFNTILRNLQESGIYKLWERASEQTGKVSTSITDNAIVALSILHLQSAFYVLLIGLMLSTFVFCYEMAIYKLKNKHKKS